MYLFVTFEDEATIFLFSLKSETMSVHINKIKASYVTP